MSKTTELDLKNDDIKGILRSYDINNLENFKELRRGGSAPLCYEITANSNRYFLKQYREGGYLDESFVFLKFLLTNNYPAVRLFDTASGETSLRYHGRTFAIFEYLENANQQYEMTKDRALEVGRHLAKLHVLGMDYQYERAYADYKYFHDLLDEGHTAKNNIPIDIQKAVDFMHERMKDTFLPSDMPKSVCHVEFLKRHLIFKDQKLHKVLDWDIVSKDYMLNDLGTTMTTAINEIIDYGVLGKIVEGYHSVRPLNTSEIHYLYEAISFGIFKNAIWALYGENPSWRNKQVENLTTFIRYTKEDFNMQLSNLITL
jgi:Ser/Thr protein kinase RdoA (MazF antagonist)